MTTIENETTKAVYSPVLKCIKSNIKSSSNQYHNRQSEIFEFMLNGVIKKGKTYVSIASKSNHKGRSNSPNKKKVNDDVTSNSIVTV